MKPADLMRARSGDLFGLLAQLEAIGPAALIIANGAQLVDAAQGWIIMGCDQPGAHAPDVDARPLFLEALDQVFIQIVAGKDGSLRKAGVVEKFSCLDAQPGQISG